MSSACRMTWASSGILKRSISGFVSGLLTLGTSERDPNSVRWQCQHR
jgi:hypothetical protein